MTEQQLADAVVELAHLLGWSVAHFRPAGTAKGWVTPVAYDGQGFPDLVLVRTRVVFAELKSERGRLSGHQETWRERIQALDRADYALWRPSDWIDGTIEQELRRRSDETAVT